MGSPGYNESIAGRATGLTTPQTGKCQPEKGVDDSKKDVQRIQDIKTKSSGNLHKAQSLAGQMANAIKDKTKMLRRWEAAKQEYPEIADMFAIAYQNLTGSSIPGEKEVKPNTPEERREVKPESLELKGDESEGDLEEIFKKAIRAKQSVKFTWSRSEDGENWSSRDVVGTPARIRRMGSGSWSISARTMR